MSLTKKWAVLKKKHAPLPHPHNTSHIEIKLPYWILLHHPYWQAYLCHQLDTSTITWVRHKNAYYIIIASNCLIVVEMPLGLQDWSPRQQVQECWFGTLSKTCNEYLYNSVNINCCPFCQPFSKTIEHPLSTLLHMHPKQPISWLEWEDREELKQQERRN